MNRKRLIIIALALVIGVVGLLVWNDNTKNEDTDTIKIGAIFPITGDWAEYGKNCMRGMEIALQEFREDHPEIKTTIVVEDDKGQAVSAISAVKKLRDIDGVDMIIGSIASGLTLSVAPEMEKSKIVMMAPTSTASEITNAGDYIFRVCVSDAYEGSCMAEYIQQNFSNSSIGLVYVMTDYGVGLKNNFIDRCDELGVTIKYETGYDPSTKDFRTIINNLKQRKIDLIYIVAQKEQIEFFSQCKQLNYKPQVTASTMLEDQELTDRLGSFMDGALYTYRSYDPTRQDSVVTRFVRDYKEKYGVTPEYFAASSFDATKVCLFAQYEYRKTDLSLKDYLYTIKGLQGVVGVLEFDENGDVRQGFSIKTIKNGNFMFLDN